MLSGSIFVFGDTTRINVPKVHVVVLFQHESPAGTRKRQGIVAKLRWRLLGTYSL